MLIFLDTEFTDFVNTSLLSIGLVSEDGREFYAESAEVDYAKCSDFTREVVVPMLGADASAILKRDVLAERLRKWLDQFSSSDIVVFTHPLDASLLLQAVAGNPSVQMQYLSGVILGSAEYDAARNETFAGDRPQHHALTDAHAMRNGYLAYQKARQATFSYLMEDWAWDISCGAEPAVTKGK
jgi:hypothetical protein